MLACRMKNGMTGDDWELKKKQEVGMKQLWAQRIECFQTDLRP